MIYTATIQITISAEDIDDATTVLEAIEQTIGGVCTVQVNQIKEMI